MIPAIDDDGSDSFSKISADSNPTMAHWCSHIAPIPPPPKLTTFFWNPAMPTIGRNKMQEVFISEVKFAVNQRQNDGGGSLREQSDEPSRDNSSDFSDTDSEVEHKADSFFLAVPKRGQQTRNPSMPNRQRSKDAKLAGENHYQRSLSPSPTTENRLAIPYMDDENGRVSPSLQLGEEAGDHRFRKFNHSIRSTASVFSGSTGDHSTWAESDEAKSSLINVLSALYAMVLVILSLAFEVSIAVVDTINSNKYDIFYIYLYSVSLLFFAYCEFFLLRSIGFFNFFHIFNGFRRFLFFRPRGSRSSTITLPEPEKGESADEAYLRKRRVSMSLKRRASHSASSAGSLYLRMGCVVFGVVGLIMKGLQLFAAFDRRTTSDCFSGTWVAETVLTAVFLFVQMFFIFQNSKLIIHRFKTVGRLGAMHLVATNLCTWIRSLVEEQMTIMHEINEGLYHQQSSKKHGHHDNDHSPNQSKNTSHASELCASAGVRYGVNTLIADVEPFMTTCIIEYSLICAAVMYILWRNIGHVPRQRVRQRKQRFHVDCTASTQGLFLGLLFMVYTIVSMVIFFTKVRSGATEDALIVFYTAYIVLFGGSIAAIGAGMYRMRRLFYVHAHKKNVILLDDILLIVGLVGQLMFCVFSVVPLNEIGFTGVLIITSSLLRMVQVLWQTVFIFFAQRLATLTPEMQEKNPGREMVTFLLMNNLALFLINTFESHKAGAIPHLFGFYGQAVWMVIAHSTVPLCIFYRFHSTVCLAEVWKHVYRVKAVDNTV